MRGGAHVATRPGQETRGGARNTSWGHGLGLPPYERMCGRQLPSTFEPTVEGTWMQHRLGAHVATRPGQETRGGARKI